jgi:hypothetical protein
MQYFAEYKDMAGSISASTTYLLAPESEMMPQVILAPGAGTIRAGKFKSDTTAISQAVEQNAKKAEIQKKVADYAKKICSHYGVSDLNFVKQVQAVILQDLSHGVDANKIPTRLAKVFPELAPRKPSQPNWTQNASADELKKLGGTKDVGDDGWSDAEPAQPANQKIGRARRAY